MPYEQLPKSLHSPQAKALYKSLCKKRVQLFGKRLFDLVGAVLLLVLLSPVMLAVALVVKTTSSGAILFWQERIGRYGRPFWICKFRTMEPHSQRLGGITVEGDQRVTRWGAVLRKTRLDELPQLWNILRGEMSFVGPRPELAEFVACYNSAMWATLLMPVGLTCPASILFRNEAELLVSENPQDTYVKVILPKKMAYNMQYVQQFSLLGDLNILIQTIISIWGRDKLNEL